jgi:hypothetical protein
MKDFKLLKRMTVLCLKKLEHNNAIDNEIIIIGDKAYYTHNLYE